ncbi:hypothetical protein ACOBQJ_03125 [Pelotomaculum propionicicum]|uniref:hypothetical protein n=1 Tax=Pelotomaculum propionicicum TaxID=258475 RepID=UPI003B822CC0
MKKNFVSLLTTLYFTLIFPVMAFAAENGINAGLETVDSEALGSKIVGIATGFGALIGAVAVGMLVYSGFRLATATTEQAKAEAKGHFIQVIIGVAVAGLAVTLVGFICQTISGAGST